MADRSIADVLAAAHRLDLTAFTEHAIGCPDWYAEHAPDNAATRGKPCDCGLTVQLEAVEMLATFVRDLLGQEPYGIDGRVVVNLGGDRTPAWHRDALRLAADLIRAAGEAGKGAS
jgi:hypothetical protein